ncbi:hotdog fold thioesterase [Nocardioides rotundus]|uniref:hotdog fold thioesterase n=1 Tax=Nocardioides rotundus TaxID=1774216 RepID=UPI0021DAC89E|nr:hotdog fold thioesterase [Nocardioides rotundus]UAL28329.1 hotdog fold thioesterase [Nocardioides rotundus]
MSTPENTAPPTLEEFLALAPEGNGALNDKMGVEVTEFSPERMVATMPVEGNTQPYGLLHGGASVVLAETLGSLGSALHAYPDRIAVGVDINATHHRAATSGTVTGVATPLHLGRSMAAWQIEITDDQGRRVCTSRITCALIPAQRD